MIRISPKTAVFFDVDDTLYCEHNFVKSGFHDVARELSQFVDPVMAYDFMIEEWQRNGRGKVFNRLIERFSLDVEVEGLVKIYREHTPRIDLYEDSIRFIDLLRVHGVPTGIITDGHNRVQRNKIKALGLNEKIQCIIVTDELGADASCWKPSAVPYRMGMEYFGSAERFVYIGDNPVKDFSTAKTLGFHTIRIIREAGDYIGLRLPVSHEADDEIRSFDEMIAWMA